MHCIIVIITNEYYNSAVDSKKTSTALNNRKKTKPTTVSHRLRTGIRLSEIKRVAKEQCLQPLLEGDQRWQHDDVRWQSESH